MSKKQKDLTVALERLNYSAKKIVETRGYTREVEKIKLLEELIREQLIDENTRRTARSSR